MAMAGLGAAGLSGKGIQTGSSSSGGFGGGDSRAPARDFGRGGQDGRPWWAESSCGGRRRAAGRFFF